MPKATSGSPVTGSAGALADDPSRVGELRPSGVVAARNAHRVIALALGGWPAAGLTRGVALMPEGTPRDVGSSAGSTT